MTPSEQTHIEKSIRNLSTFTEVFSEALAARMKETPAPNLTQLRDFSECINGLSYAAATLDRLDGLLDPRRKY